MHTSSATIEPLSETLLLEAMLSATNIGIGLTALRRYSFADKGRFFAALFSTTIGIERLFKVSIVLDHFLNHGSAPTNDFMKRQIGHEISALVAKGREINHRFGFNISEAEIDDGIVQSVVEALTKFAKHTRYYNLDVVAGANKPNDEEPLAHWSRVVGNEIVTRHHKVTRAILATLAHGQLHQHTRGIVIAFTGDDGSSIRDSAALAAAAVKIETKQKWSVYYVYTIVEFGINLLEKLDRSFGTPVNVSEPFRTFASVGRKVVLRRRVWEPYH